MGARGLREGLGGWNTTDTPTAGAGRGRARGRPASRGAGAAAGATDRHEVAVIQNPSR